MQDGAFVALHQWMLPALGRGRRVHARMSRSAAGRPDRFFQWPPGHKVYRRD